MSSLSLLCNVSLSLGVILWPSELLSSCGLLLDLDTYRCVDKGCVSSISKEGYEYYCSKTKHNFIVLEALPKTQKISKHQYHENS